MTTPVERLNAHLDQLTAHADDSRAAVAALEALPGLHARIAELEAGTEPYLSASPDKAGGLVCIGGTGLLARDITAEVSAQGVDAVLAAHPGLTPAQVEVAQWWEATGKRWRR